MITQNRLFVGELSLDGYIRPVRGVLPIVREAQKRGFTEVYVPKVNAEEASLVEGISVYTPATLRELIDHLEGTVKLSPHKRKAPDISEEVFHGITFDDIRGQESAKRGLEIAAAGKHNIVLYGPPGTGKTILAKAFCSILPSLTFDEALEVTSIHSVAGLLNEPLITSPPFRSPHHTASHVSLVGGGAVPRPGEVTLAHRGVLFLDEFPEFERRSIDALREPLEDRVVSVTRAKGSARFPASFIMVAAMNPSPHGSPTDPVSPHEQARYERKISGPIVDRIDMWIEVAHIPHEKLSELPTETGLTNTTKQRIASAREAQQKRFKNGLVNSEMSVKDIDKHISLDQETKKLLNMSAEKLSLSPRAYHRIIKLARTIADLSGDETVSQQHVLEALQYRPKITTS